MPLKPNRVSANVALNKFRKLGNGASVSKECHHFQHYIGDVLQWLMMKAEMRDMARVERKEKPVGSQSGE